MKQIPEELLEQLLEGYEKPEDLLGSEGLLANLQKAVMERALEAELTAHLGYHRHDPAGRGSGNSRNGHGSKTVLTDRNKLELEVPRDRNGSFEPQLVKKRQSRLPGFDEQVIALYARGLSQRDVRSHLEEIYGVSVSPELISRVTDAVVEELQTGRSGPWTRSTRWSSWMPSGCGSATRARCATRPCIWPWASATTAARRCWGCGSSRTRAPSSGCG